MSAFVFSFERPVSAADFRNLAQQTDWACDRSIEGIAASLARSYLVLV